MYDTQDQCFSLTGAAQYLGRSPRWLQYQLQSSNPPPAYQVPSAVSIAGSRRQKKTWIFKKSDLDRWLEQFRAGGDLDKIIAEVVAEVTGDTHRK